LLVAVFHNGKKVKLNSLSPDQKFDLFVESSLGSRAKENMRSKKAKYDQNPNYFIKRTIGIGSTFSTINGKTLC
jgi:hypothetical protein